MSNIKATKIRLNMLKQLGIEDITSLFEYYPYRYENIENIDYLKWKINQNVNFEAVVTTIPKLNYYRKNQSVLTFDCINNDDTFKISIFNRPWLNSMNIGDKITIFGIYKGYNKVIASNINKNSLISQLGIKPIYSLRNKISANVFNKIILDNINNIPNENFIPNYLMNNYQLLNRIDALKQIHHPDNSDVLKKALETLKYEEFLKFNLAIINNRNQRKEINDKYRKNINNKEIYKFISTLPFNLTNSQNKVLNEILSDMSSNTQMNRLVQGDVGCGKTIIAFIAMYACCLDNHQACLMAPTEVLANQHYQNILKLLSEELNICYLHADIPHKEKKEMLRKIENKEIDIIIGTHSLFQEAVKFNNLGLVITDEQHRFGVKQRQALISKGEYVDILSMSATPIPRTLANTLYGDIDVSTIDEVPNSHKIIHTYLLNVNSFIPKINEINKLLNQGNQMYIICSSIEENDNLVRNVNDIYINLAKYYAGKYSIGLLHGKMDVKEKEQVIKNFENNEIQILVSTTVVEVGIDVKNANIIVIYDANRFGLSQLHQLRGRVGRGNKEGYCYLLNDKNDEETLERLNTIVKYNDGFKISEVDLKLRGPGDLLGFKQSGLPSFKLGNVIDDYQLLNKVREDALTLYNKIDQYPNIKGYLTKYENFKID